MQGWLWMMTVGLPAMNPLIRHRDTVLGTDRRRNRISISLAVSDLACNTNQPKSLEIIT